jgi:SNF2 family DNA or RNA helicase
MIILHAAQSEVGLLLWGETPRSESLWRGARKKKGIPSPSPRALGADELLTLLEKYFPLADSPALPIEAVGWLPSTKDGPIPSSPMLASDEDHDGNAALAPWLIPACLAEYRALLAVLTNCIRKHTLAPGVVVGNDLAFWGEMLRFVGALVARQQYLPGVRIVGGKAHAVWEPVLNADDQERLLLYARAMPPSGRALSDPDDDTPPVVEAASVVRSFLTDAVDAMVRSTLDTPRDLPGTRKAIIRTLSVHDAWMDALRSEQGGIDWAGTDVSTLRKDILRWTNPIAVTMSSPVRLCFRLEEPGQDDPYGKESWKVSYFLQPHTDRSLLLPLASVWSGRGAAKHTVELLGPRPKEYVLASLGQAARICPMVSASLKQVAPEGFDLDTNSAHEFLTRTASALEQAGFGVMLPAWWTRTGTKLRPVVRAKVKSPAMSASGGLSLDAIAQFDWQASLGDEILSLKELTALAKLKATLIRVRGQWVEVNAGDISAALDFWKKHAAREATVREIVHMALGGMEKFHGLGMGGIEADGWIGTLLGQLESKASFEELPPPEDLVATLRPYQVRGFSWLSFLRSWGLGACLADDMGLGKTIQTLTLLLHERHLHGDRPHLLVCPTSVVNNWVQEASRFAPSLPVMVHHGAGRKKDASFMMAVSDHAVVVSSYGLLQRDVVLFQKIDWGGVILDEAQNIKNSETKQAKAARSLRAHFRIALTGTPVENNVGDLWSIMEFLNPALLGTPAEFRRRFFLPIQSGSAHEASEQLKRLTGPFILRRIKTDKTIIADLPDKVERKELCRLTKEQASLYAAVLKDMDKTLDEAEGIQRKGLILATLSKLKQVCNHPTHFLGDKSAVADRSGKLERLTQMLEEVLEAGERALVFTQFKEMGEILKTYLQEFFGQEALFLHGGVPRKQRDAMVERFQMGENSPSVFILSLKAGGTGLNLTNANHVFHFDRWWNPAVENQATDRAFRIGQHRNVMVHKFVCVGTLEEKIDAMIERKKDVADSVVGTGEAWLTELTDAEIKDVFALRRDALGE